MHLDGRVLIAMPAYERRHSVLFRYGEFDSASRSLCVVVQTMRRMLLRERQREARLHPAAGVHPDSAHAMAQQASIVSISQLLETDVHGYFLYACR